MPSPQDRWRDFFPRKCNLVRGFGGFLAADFGVGVFFFATDEFPCAVAERSMGVAGSLFRRASQLFRVKWYFLNRIADSLAVVGVLVKCQSEFAADYPVKVVAGHVMLVKLNLRLVAGFGKLGFALRLRLRLGLHLNNVRFIHSRFHSDFVSLRLVLFRLGITPALQKCADKDPLRYVAVVGVGMFLVISAEQRSLHCDCRHDKHVGRDEHHKATKHGAILCQFLRFLVRITALCALSVF